MFRICYNLELLKKLEAFRPEIKRISINSVSCRGKSEKKKKEIMSQCICIPWRKKNLFLILFWKRKQLIYRSLIPSKQVWKRQLIHKKQRRKLLFKMSPNHSQRQFRQRKWVKLSWRRWKSIKRGLRDRMRKRIN